MDVTERLVDGYSGLLSPRLLKPLRGEFMGVTDRLVDGYSGLLSPKAVKTNVE
jgi:hypothetical protein